jgi:hypothetical protein
MSRLLYRLSYAALRGLLYLKMCPGAIENAPLFLPGSGKTILLIALVFSKFKVIAKAKIAQNSVLTNKVPGQSILLAPFMRENP